MADVLIPILAFVGVMTLGGSVLLMLSSRKRSLRPRLGLDDAQDAESESLGDQMIGRRWGVLRLVNGLGRFFSLGRVSAGLKEQLTRAGYHRDSAAMTYLGAKLGLLVVGAVILLTLVMPLEISPWRKAFLVGVVPAILFFVPNFLLRIARQRRTTEIRNTLPAAIDLLEVCVSAGMGLDTAWNAVGDEIRYVSDTLADEMTLVNLEMQLGAPRTDAMRNMAERTEADELNQMVALLVQSERFGTSVADALRTFAESMRESRSQRAEEQAEKMAVKLLFPLVFFIFPVMLLVMAGPAGITLHKYMGLGG